MEWPKSLPARLPVWALVLLYTTARVALGKMQSDHTTPLPKTCKVCHLIQSKSESSPWHPKFVAILASLSLSTPTHCSSHGLLTHHLKTNQFGRKLLVTMWALTAHRASWSGWYRGTCLRSWRSGLKSWNIAGNIQTFQKLHFVFSSATIPPINTDTVYSNEHILSDRWNKFAQGFFSPIVKIFSIQVLFVGLHTAAT